MTKTELYLKRGQKNYVPYEFEAKGGELFISDGVESLPLEKWLAEEFTGYVYNVPYVDELRKQKQKIKILKLLELFSDDKEIKKIVEKELNLIRKRAEILNKRELVRERGGRRR